MPKLRKKTTARKVAKRTSASSKKRASKKPAAKSKVQLKSLEKNLATMLKKALNVAKSESKKATTEAARLQKKLSAAEKKNNAVLAKQAKIESKIAAKGGKTAKKSLNAVKKAGRTAAANVKKIQKQSTVLDKAAQNAKCQEEMLQSLAKTIAQFKSDWQKKEKSAAHQAAAHAPKPKKAPVAVKKPSTENKLEVKKMTRPTGTPSMSSPSDVKKSYSPNNPFENDDSSF